MRIYLILALLLAIIVTIFAVQNNEPVDVSFLTFELNGSLALVLMITLTLGIIIGILVSAPASLRRRMEIGGLTQEPERRSHTLRLSSGQAEPQSHRENLHTSPVSVVGTAPRREKVLFLPVAVPITCPFRRKAHSCGNEPVRGKHFSVFNTSLW